MRHSHGALLALALVSCTGCRQYFENRTLLDRASKCGSEVAWAANWEDAAQRGKSENKLVLVAFQNYPGFEVGDLPSLGPFMDERIIAVTNARFVPLRFRLGMDAPFVQHEVYGIGPAAFGVALLLAHHDGSIVAETFSLDSTVALTFLQRNLPEGAAEETLATLTDDLLPEESEALQLAQNGDVDAAQRTLEPVANASPRARFLDATLLLAAGEKDSAIDKFRALGLEDPETRWSWHAAAFVTNPLLAAVERIDLVPPSAEDIEEGMPIESQPLESAERDDARRGAIDWLLSRQREDGSWPDPHRIANAGGVEHTDLSLATIALGGLALLLEARAERAIGNIERADRLVAAATRSLECLVEHTPIERSDAKLMNYSVWSNPYTLRFATECAHDGIGDAHATLALAERVLSVLVEQQKEGGGWSYYLSATAEGSANPLNVSMSFTTACVLDALQRAQAHGLVIPADVMSRAIECLLDMRGDDGDFCYLELHTVGLTSGGTPGDAAGRGPACALPLVRADRLDEAAVRTALVRFVEHLPVLAREQGKVLMHCGPEAEGSHYLLFDYQNAAAAWATLPPDDRDRDRLREPIVAAILAARNVDGSFVDNPAIGRAAGSALAAIALRALAR